MNIEEKLENIFVEAKKNKKINMLDIYKLELSDEKLEYVINFLSDNDIVDVNDINEENSNNKEVVSTEFYTSDSVRMYLNEISKYELLTKEEEKRLFKLYKQGDLLARKKIIESNLKLVIKPAKKYYNMIENKPAIDFLDIIQCGNIGLMKAVEKFDSNKKYKFSTYAMWWIRQSMRRFIDDNKRIIRVPIHTQDLSRRIKNFENDFLNKNQRMPSLEEYVKNIDETRENIILALQTEREILSLDMKFEEDGDNLENFIVSPTKEFINSENKIIVDEILNIGKKYLTEDELNILILRYGVRNKGTHTLEEVGKILGCTRQNISWKEINALRKLKHALKCDPIYRKIIYSQQIENKTK